MKTIPIISLLIWICLNTLQAQLTPEATIIVDHNALEQFDLIPSTWIEEAKKLSFAIMGESHSRAYMYGLSLLEAQNAEYAVNETWGGTPETSTNQYLRAYRTTGGEEDFYTNTTAVENVKSFLTANSSSIDVFGFGWCWDMTWHNDPGGTEDPVYGVHWAGSSADGPDGDIRWGLDDGDNTLTGNSVNMDTYLAAVEEYRSNNPETITIFTTGPVDGQHGNENGYQRYLKHEYIRNYVQTNGGILFDYADILCWDDTVQYMDSWNDTDGAVTGLHSFQNGYPDLATGGSGYDGGNGGCHISEEGCIAIAKGIWWMMARIAGWDGVTDEGDPEPGVTSVIPFSDTKNNSTDKISIYPNPCRDYIFINSTSGKTRHIDLYSIDGKLIKSYILQQGDSRIDLGNVQNGIYLLKVNTGHDIFVERLVVQQNK